jgi:hypothetical protein
LRPYLGLFARGSRSECCALCLRLSVQQQRGYLQFRVCEAYEVFELMKIKRLSMYSTLHFDQKSALGGCSARRSEEENNK